MSICLETVKNDFIHDLNNYDVQESQTLFFIFVEKYLGWDKHKIFYNKNKLVDDSMYAVFRNAIDELNSGKPYQQILGEAKFFGETFRVDEHVLIPRPETEELLEFAISKINEEQLFTQNENIVKILDIGTGSGIISIIIKKIFPSAEVYSIDISEKALKKATENAQLHQVKIHFQKMNFLIEFPKNNFDVIISNPPYIGWNEENEVHHSVKKFEPRIALFPPINDALIFYKRIRKFAKHHLNKNGIIFLEINQKLGKETINLYQNFSSFQLIKDISGNDRIIFAQNK